MQIELSADEAVILDAVGNHSMLRGREYARRGMVIEPRWLQPGKHLAGQVRGSGQRPYSAIVIITTGPDGELRSFRGTCTCPVAQNCKHTAALLLASRPQAAQPVEVERAEWEQSLRELVVAPRVPDAEQPVVALQFDLGEAASGTGFDSLGVRPVIRGANGGWVRTGISWSNLGRVAYSQRRLDRDHSRVLFELLAISGYQHSYYSSQPIRLDNIASRRVWDVLAEARALGIPLINKGKTAVPVAVGREPVTLALDLSRADSALLLQPRLTTPTEHIPLATSLLLGSPAHGIASWTQLKNAAGKPELMLQLAPLADPLDPQLRGLLDAGRLAVPESDESRFFGSYYPALLRRVAITSSDGTVELPTIQPPGLVLTVDYTDRARAALEWHWAYPHGEGSRAEPLWPEPGAGEDRDSATENRVLEQVRVIAGEVELFELTAEGRRLARRSDVGGMAAVRFTNDVLPQLQELDGVTIEHRGEIPDYRESEAAPVVSIAGSQSTDRDWFDLNVTVSVDGEQVAFEQLFVALATEQTHLILASGTYFSLDRPEFAQLAGLIAEARALQDSPAATLRLNRYQASIWDDLDRLGVMTGQAAQWQRSVRALTDGAELTAVAPPPSLEATLRSYQQEGFNWPAFLFDHDLGGVLADEMGLGKTLQALALVCHVKDRGLADGPFLIVAPTSVVSNWATECARFAPSLKMIAISETERRRGIDLTTYTAGADIVLTSYTLFRLEHEQYADLQWSGLVLDEAQFVKNHQAEAYRCAKKLDVPFKLAITGTPMENNLAELWALLSITAPGLLANLTRFTEFFRTPIEKHQNTDRLVQLRRRVKPLMLRRAKQQVLPELPDKQEQVLELELNPKHRRIYQTYLQRERQKVLGLLSDLDKNRFEIFRSLTLLRQASLDVGLVDPKHAKVSSTKLDAMMELLTEIASEGHRTLVFSQFTRFLGAARDRLDAAGIDSCYLDGKTRSRAKQISAFRDGTAPVFLISLKAGGFGLNLTEADYCVLLDPWWNPATEAQAVDRVHRLGQTKKVMVYRLISKDTIEDKVMSLKATKAALFSSVMDDGEFSSSAITAADIRSMLE